MPRVHLASVRGRYLNSQMGPLAATTWADEAAIRPRNPRLEWMDHMADDKNRLEVRLPERPERSEASCSYRMVSQYTQFAHRQFRHTYIMESHGCLQ